MKISTVIIACLLSLGAARAQSYNAFGDSITLGVGASDYVAPNPSPAKAYVPLLAAHYGWSIANHGHGGDMVPDQAGYAFNTSPAIGDVSTVWLGTNEKNWYGDVVARQPIFQMGHLALLLQLGIEQPAKITGQSMTLSGSWGNLGPSIDPHGVYSSTNGSTAYATPSGRHIVLVGWWNAAYSGQFTVTIDDRTFGPFAATPDGAFAPSQYIGYGPFALAFTDLPSSGPHNVTITVSSATSASNVVYISFVAGLNGPGATHPKVVTANLYNYTAAADAGEGTNPARNGRYSSLIQRNVAICQRLGLNVALADVAATLTAADLSSADGLHPADSGYAKIATAFESAIDGYVIPADQLAQMSMPTFIGRTYVEGGHFSMTTGKLELGP